MKEGVLWRTVQGLANLEKEMGGDAQGGSWPWVSPSLLGSQFTVPEGPPPARLRWDTETPQFCGMPTSTPLAGTEGVPLCLFPPDGLQLSSDPEKDLTLGCRHLAGVSRGGQGGGQGVGPVISRTWGPWP